MRAEGFAEPEKHLQYKFCSMLKTHSLV